MLISKFDEDLFLQEYWQKKPCLIKQFCPNFSDPIDEHDLAGLAQEVEVDSRIVSNTNGKWDVVQGPFNDFESVCTGHWSLLVQGVDRYIAQVSELSQLVSFIPNWRFDDVMVSYSVPHAGVGAHTDEYDVFIIQGKGSRRWQVGLPNQNQPTKGIKPVHALLKQVDAFTPVIDEVLSTGDAIYIPPAHPHKGETISACLNYSLGFRAPTNLEVLHGILDEGETLEKIQKRYADPNLGNIRSANPPSMMTKNELQAIKQDIFTLLNSNEADNALLQFVSRQSLPNFALEEPLSFDDVFCALEQNIQIIMSQGVKPVYIEQQTQVFNFFIDGHLFSADIKLQEALQRLLSHANATHVFYDYKDSVLRTATSKQKWVNVLTQLINAGYWEILDS